MRDFTGLAVTNITDPDVRRNFRHLDYFLRDLSRGVLRIEKGQVPSGAGTPIPVGEGGTLTDYLFLPGRPGGQTIHGVDLDAATASAVVAIDPGFPISATVGTLGPAYQRFESQGSPIGDLAPYSFDATPTTDIAIAPKTFASGFQVIPADGTSGIRLMATASRAFVQVGRKDSTNKVQESALTLGGQGATVMQRLATEAQYLTLNITGGVGQNGAVMTANSARVGINTDPFDFSSAVASASPGSLYVSRLGSSVITDPATVVLERPVTAHWPTLEIRRGPSGGSPNKAIGALGWQIDGQGQMKWYDNGTRRLSVRSIGDNGSESGNGGLQVLNGADRLQFETLPEIALFVDNVTSHLIRIANTSTEVNRLVISSAGSAPFSRLAIAATSTILGPAGIGAIAAPLSSRILTVVNSAATVLSGFDSLGAYFLSSGGALNSLYASDANGVGSWKTAATIGLARVAANETISGLWSFIEGTQGTITFQEDVGAAGTGYFIEFKNGSGASLGGIQQSGTAAAGALVMLGLGVTDGTNTGLFQTSLTGNRNYTLPDLTGTVVLTTGAQNLSAKTLLYNGNSILGCDTASTGVAFADRTTATKKLRAVLSGAVGNNSFTLANAAARDYKFGDDSGTVDLVVAPTSATTDKTGQTGNIGATTVYTTVHAGMYRISFYAVFTAVTGAGNLTVTGLWTDPQQAQTATINEGGVIAYAAAGSFLQGRKDIYATSGSTIQFSTTLTGTGTYNVYVRVESLT